MSAEKHEGGITATTKASSALGLVAASALAVLVNVAVARHYVRWDVTTSQIYTLSQPTKDTLRGLKDDVDVYVLLSASDPLSTSVKHLLLAYESETTHLRTHWLDPDRSPAEFLAFQQKYDILAGKTQDGRVIADASMVVVRGDARWFLTPADLVDASEANEGRARPKLEQGITTGIRQVLGGERIKVCFTRGHDEASLEDPGTRGLGELRHRLERDNLTPTAVTLSGPQATKDLASCGVVIVAGPGVPFAEADTNSLVGYVEGGGNVMLLVNPQPDADKKRVQPSGLEPVAALGGIELQHDLVFERDKEAIVPKSFGEAFFGAPKEHPITKGFGPEVIEGGAKILIVLAQSLRAIPTSSVHPQTIVETSKDAFGMLDFFAWADAPQGDPTPRGSDHAGPLAVGMASELLPKAGAKDGRGARVVVLGAASPIHGQSWQEPAFRGGAYLTESAISWLTSRPQIVDIPPKPSVLAGLRLTEASLAQVRNYVTIYIPLATALCGLAVYLRRRSTERK